MMVARIKEGFTVLLASEMRKLLGLKPHPPGSNGSYLSEHPNTLLCEWHPLGGRLAKLSDEFHGEAHFMIGTLHAKDSAKDTQLRVCVDCADDEKAKKWATQPGRAGVVMRRIEE